MNEQIRSKALAFIDEVAEMIRQDILNEFVARLEGSVAAVTPKRAKAKPGRKPGRKAKLEDLTESQRAAYDVVKAAKGPIATADIAKALKVSGSTALYHLKTLEKYRLIKRMREGHAVYFQLR